MNEKFEKSSVAEIYEKPSMQVFEMEMENALMMGASGEKPGNGWGDKNHEHTGAPGQSDNNARSAGKSYLPEHNTKPYMGDSDE